MRRFSSLSAHERRASAPYRHRSARLAAAPGSPLEAPGRDRCSDTCSSPGCSARWQCSPGARRAARPGGPGLPAPRPQSPPPRPAAGGRGAAGTCRAREPAEGMRGPASPRPTGSARRLSASARARSAPARSLRCPPGAEPPHPRGWARPRLPAGREAAAPPAGPRGRQAAGTCMGPRFCRRAAGKRHGGGRGRSAQLTACQYPRACPRRTRLNKRPRRTGIPMRECRPAGRFLVAASRQPLAPSRLLPLAKS